MDNRTMLSDAMEKIKVGHRNSGKNGKSLVEDAYYRIKHLIFNQKLVPGQRLVYDDLARMLSMSRTPIINALTRLEQQGLVVSESYRGFYVRPMDYQEAWDAFGLREAIEVYAVKQAIQMADAEDMKKLEEKLYEHENYKPSYYDRKKIFLDATFHLQIAEMAKNRILKWHLKINLEHVYLRANLDNYDTREMEIAATEHRRLVRKMKNKDILGSIETMRNHIITTRDHVIACLSDNDPVNDVRL